MGNVAQAARRVKGFWGAGLGAGPGVGRSLWAVTLGQVSWRREASGRTFRPAPADLDLSPREALCREHACKTPVERDSVGSPGDISCMSVFLFILHAARDETFRSLRKVAAARAMGARRPSSTEEGACGELAEPQTARRQPAPARAGGSRQPGLEVTRSVRPEGPRGVVASALAPPSLHPRSTLAPLGGEPTWGEGPPPAETSSRLEMVLLCPFGMSHVWAREVFLSPRSPT